jgi:hypothetical protein
VKRINSNPTNGTKSVYSHDYYADSDAQINNHLVLYPTPSLKTTKIKTKTTTTTFKNQLSTQTQTPNTHPISPHQATPGLDQLLCDLDPDPSTKTPGQFVIDM